MDMQVFLESLVVFTVFILPQIVSALFIPYKLQYPAALRRDSIAA